jgi:RNA-binding protein
MEVYVTNLLGYQKKFLKGLAHGRKPMAYVGQKGLSPTLIQTVDASLTKHELIKVKFIEFKEKEQKQEIAGVIEQETKSELVGMIGHVAIFYRQQPISDKRRIQIPKRQKPKNKE